MLVSVVLEKKTTRYTPTIPAADRGIVALGFWSNVVSQYGCTTRALAVSVWALKGLFPYQFSISESNSLVHEVKLKSLAGWKKGLLHPYIAVEAYQVHRSHPEIGQPFYVFTFTGELPNFLLPIFCLPDNVASSVGVEVIVSIKQNQYQAQAFPMRLKNDHPLASAQYFCHRLLGQDVAARNKFQISRVPWLALCFPRVMFRRQSRGFEQESRLWYSRFARADETSCRSPRQLWDGKYCLKNLHCIQ